MTWVYANNEMTARELIRHWKLSDSYYVWINAEKARMKLWGTEQPIVYAFECEQIPVDIRELVAVCRGVIVSLKCPQCCE